MLEAAKNAPAAGPAATTGGDAPKKEEKVEEEEATDVAVTGLFGDGDDYY